MTAEPPGRGEGATAGASREILSRGLIYTIGTAAPILSNIAVTPVVGRVLTPSEYGVVSVMFTLMQVTMFVAGLGLNAAITRQGILSRAGHPGAAGLVFLGSAAGAAVCLFAAVTSRWWASLFHIHDAGALLWSLLAGAGLMVMSNAQAFLRLLDRAYTFVLLSLVATLGGPIIGLILVLAGSRSATGYLMGLALGAIVSAAVGLWTTWRAVRPVASLTELGEALRIGVPVVPHVVAMFLASGVLVFVANAQFGKAEAGLIYRAVLLGSATLVVTGSMNNAWGPLVYRAAPPDRAAVIEITGRDIAVLAGAAAGFCAMVAPFVLPILNVGPELTPAVGWVAIGAVLSVPYLCSVNLIFAAGRTILLAVISPTCVLLGAVAAWFCGRSGLNGVGTGMAVTYAFLGLATYALAATQTRPRWRWQVLALPVLAGCAVCVAGGLIGVTGWWLVLRALFAVVLAATAGWVVLRVRRT